MCSSRGICGDNNRPNRSSSTEGTGSGAHYALCALGVGLIALGIVMIVWTVIPMDGENLGGSPTTSNSTGGDGNKDEEEKDSTDPSIVAMVLVGVGAAMLLLAIILGVRNKKRQRNASSQPVATGVPLMNHAARAQEEVAAERAALAVPSYEEVVGSGDYPVRQSNLRSSTSQLPSYEDIIAAVENEGREPTDNPSEITPLNDSTPAPTEPAAEIQTDPPGLKSNPSLPTRSASRASRLLRPLRVRRIKSDKLHLKDFRIQIRSPTQNPVTIEPITPPPQYDNKMPELG
ncbi:transmembrane protein 51b [Cyclopterus lumpus]|uniref:Transmembrane protein 51b n=1 Tax=Cyclopterus lumpus TaxID=8103 RepID=A0A8C2WBN4_CYCLU|nr:transmembrane protein 51b [Cyclopterus lumpus]